MRAPAPFALVAVLAAACGDGEVDLRTLTADDVAVVRPGDAVGTAFSGTYQADDVRLDASRCRRGRILSAGAAELHVVQTDGLISVTSPMMGTIPCQGGVDASGRFAGGCAIVTDDSSSFSQIEGQFHLRGTRPLSMSFTIWGTAQGPVFDCDLRVSGVGVYRGPP